MNKPTGTYRCLACGQKWDGSELYQDPSQAAIVWTCGNLFCGGVVAEIKEAPADLYAAIFAASMEAKKK